MAKMASRDFIERIFSSRNGDLLNETGKEKKIGKDESVQHSSSKIHP